MIFRSITGRSEIDLLVSRSAKQEVSARWVAGLLERGESRLQWCRMALPDDGELLAAHAMDSWSLDRDPGDTPTFVLLLGHVDEEAAVALLNHDLRASGAAEVDARLVLEADSPAELRTLREGQQRVLEASGFTVEVDRVRLHWTKSSGPGPVPPQPRRAGRLTFRPATTLAEGDLIEMFAAVSDGSADLGMITGRAAHGVTSAAGSRTDPRNN